MTAYGNTLLHAVAGAVRPWESVDAIQYRATLKVSNQREIDICLRCPSPECHNCFDAWKNAFGNIRYSTNKTRREKRQ